jgi:hypothetical protein
MTKFNHISKDTPQNNIVHTTKYYDDQDFCDLHNVRVLYNQEVESIAKSYRQLTHFGNFIMGITL